MFGEKRRKSPLVATEFTTRGHPQMRASICFASITVILFKKIKEKTQFEYVKGKQLSVWSKRQKAQLSTLNIPLEVFLDIVIRVDVVVRGFRQTVLAIYFCLPDFL